MCFNPSDEFYPESPGMKNALDNIEYLVIYPRNSRPVRLHPSNKHFEIVYIALCKAFENMNREKRESRERTERLEYERLKKKYE